MRGTVALSVALLCIGAGSAIVAAQAPGAQAPDTQDAASAAPEAAAPAAPTKPIDAGTYAVRLRDLEQRIMEMSERREDARKRLDELIEQVEVLESRVEPADR